MSNPTIRRNDQGQAVKSLQQQLSQLGYPLVADGLWRRDRTGGQEIPEKEGLWADGVVGPKTWAKINQRINQHPQAFDPIVDQYLDLGPGEYIHSSSKKIGVCLHHTVSGGRPERVVEVWKADRRGPVGTHFVIGRGGASGNAESDGKIVQCIPIDAWAHHILSKRMGFSNEHNILVNQSYVGIELCSWGILEKKMAATMLWAAKLRCQPMRWPSCRSLSEPIHIGINTAPPNSMPSIGCWWFWAKNSISIMAKMAP